MKSILQTKEWANFKASQAFKLLTIDDLFVHRRELPYGQSFLYLPEVSSKSLTAQNIDQIKKLSAEQGSIFTRVEFVDSFSKNADKVIRSFGFNKAFEEVQPKWRQIIDISKTEEEVLSQMKSKGRYNIRVAERHEVKIQKLNIKNPPGRVQPSGRSQNDNGKIKEFYDLVQSTIQREKIAGRSFEYFQKMIDSFSDTDYLEIYIASHQGKPLAAALISFYDGVASYLYGGSSSESRDVMAPYAMHWQIIKDAKERGMSSYDMLGRSKPEGGKSKWAGVTRFKEQFGGEAVEVLGSYDYITKPFHYKIFMFLEKMRRKSS